MVAKKKVNISTSREAFGDRIAFSLTPVCARLSKGKKSFRARVRTRGTFDTMDIAREMTRRGAVKDMPTCIYFLALLHEIIAEKTLAGYRLKTEFFETGLSIRGTFDSVDDGFDSERHKVLPTVCTTKAFKAAVAAATVLKSNAQIINCRFAEPPPLGKYDLVVRCRNGADPSFAPAETSLRGIIVKGE